MKLSWDVNRMSSFAVSAIGYLARNPEVVTTDKGNFCRFCLTSEDYTEEDEQGRYTVIVQSIWFVATHLVGAAIADSARKGDQLFVEGKIRRHHWTASASDDATFVVTGFRFGSRKGGSGAVNAAACAQVPTSPAYPRKRSPSSTDAHEICGELHRNTRSSGALQCEEPRRLHTSGRRVHRVNDLPAEIVEAIKGARMDSAHDHLNALLDEE